MQLHNYASNHAKTFGAILLFICVFIIIVLRRPDIILNAQPWAEDGTLWMANIYNDSLLTSLISSENGYFQTISRLAYGIGLFFGISNAALISNIIAISIRCFFVLFLLSDRMRLIDIFYRIAVVIYFIFMPNLAEGYVNITNAQWYLALYLLSVIIADSPDTKLWKVHDFAVLILSALSGPFIVFIAVCQALKRISQHGSILEALKKMDAFDIIIGICTCIQTVAILSSFSSERSSAPLGSSIGLLANIISYRIIGGTFFANDSIITIGQQNILNLVLFFVLSFTVVVLFIRFGWRVRVAILFPLLLISFALAKPMMSTEGPQWPLFLSGGGERYFFITNFAFFCMIVFIISRIKAGKFIIGILIVAMIPSFISYFRIAAMPEVGYRRDIATFKSLPSGETMDIRINPPGWKMTLIKK